MPGSLWAFLILWLVEERGLSTQMAPMVFGAMIVGTAISNVIGGFLGDWADKKSPKYGRTIIGQLRRYWNSIYLCSLLENGELGHFATDHSLLRHRVVHKLPGKGSKEPMMSAVVPPELRSTAFAMTTFIESGFAPL